MRHLQGCQQIHRGVNIKVHPVFFHFHTGDITVAVHHPGRDKEPIPRLGGVLCITDGNGKRPFGQVVKFILTKAVKSIQLPHPIGRQFIITALAEDHIEILII